MISISLVAIGTGFWPPLTIKPIISPLDKSRIVRIAHKRIVINVFTTVHAVQAVVWRRISWVWLASKPPASNLHVYPPNSLSSFLSWKSLESFTSFLVHSWWLIALAVSPSQFDMNSFTTLSVIRPKGYSSNSQ